MISPDDPQPFEEEDEDECFNHYREILLKWIADGAESIEEVAMILEAEARRLRAHAAEGWFLTEAIDGGRGTLDLTPEAEARGVLRPCENADDPERWEPVTLSGSTPSNGAASTPEEPSQEDETP